MPSDGMSLRDWFAGKAMLGLIIRWSIDKRFEIGDPRAVAEMAGQFADAMIAKREEAAEDERQI